MEKRTTLFFLLTRSDFANNMPERRTEFWFKEVGKEGSKRQFFFDNQSSGHNTVRPQFMRDSASIFFAQCMNLELVDAPPDFSLPVGLNTIESEGYCLFFFDLLRLSFPP
jgi:hypothetical protein